MKKPNTRSEKRSNAEAQMKGIKPAAASDNAPKPVARPRKRKIDAIIKKLDVSTLQEDQLTEILLHLASALNVRKALGGPSIALTQLSSKLCYTKSGESAMVSLYNGPFKVGETTESNALARGILPCG